MKKILLPIYLLICCLVAQGQSFDSDSLLQQKPSVEKLVNDYTGTLTDAQTVALENKLVNLSNTTSTQVAIVVIPTTNGMDVADYAVELGRKWGVGGKDFNNGVVLLVAKNDRKMNISTGYGLEGSLTDAESSFILDEIIRPRFKGDDYYGGLEAGADAIVDAVQGTYNTPREYGKGGGKSSILFFVIVIIIIFILMRNNGGGKGGSFMSRRGYRGLGGLPWIIPTGGGGGGGGWTGGGGGGGGFGGFGGGGFGGGGASGSW